MESNLLQKGLEALSLSPSPEQLGQLETMVDEIMFFNPTYRLVSNTDRDEIIIRHILDSASAVPYFISEGKTEIVDLGTGAGFPGLVLAVFLTSGITLCERMTRRVNFLKGLIPRMGLANVTVDSRSAEDIDKFKGLERRQEILAQTPNFFAVGIERISFGSPIHTVVAPTVGVGFVLPRKVPEPL